MEKPGKHIFLCASFRAGGEPQGVCHKKGSINLISYLEGELSDRGMAGVSISMTGCLNACDRGPIMIEYPENNWYCGVDGEGDIDEILDAMENNSIAEKYLLL